MATLVQSLPAPVNSTASHGAFAPNQAQKLSLDVEIASNENVPPYGHRSGYAPKALEDFGDGGAFPEIHVLQHPLNMGRTDAAPTSVVPLQVDSEGNIEYSSIINQGQRKGKTVWASHNAMVPVMNQESLNLEKPDQATIEETAARTAAALGQLVTKKVSNMQVTHVETVKEGPTFIRYTPADQQEYGGGQQRIIRLQEAQKDPLEPPKFRHKKIPNAPPSPPVPVMHSPQRKLTKEDMDAWNIPPCVSNWKNIQGKIIPLDKRLMSDGRRLQDIKISERHGQMANALMIAERTANKELEERAKLAKAIRQKQHEKTEQELLAMAQQSLDGIEGEEISDEDEDAVAEADERDEMRSERKREIQRQMNQERRKADRRKDKGIRDRNETRDVSERVALGQTVQRSTNTQQDYRMFNQDGGLDSGFGADDDNAVYSKPLFNDKKATYIYRPKAGDLDTYGSAEEVKGMLEKSTTKFTADVKFKGTDVKNTTRDGPVQFERHEENEADPFGLDHLLASTSTKSKKRTLDTIGGQGHMSSSAGSSHGYSVEEDRAKRRRRH